MKMYTVCYLLKDDKILMLYRNKKENDINKGKWIGVGGKIEKGEDPFQSVKRETLEETSLTLNKVDLRGIIIFVYNGKVEYIYVFTSDDFKGTLGDCNEGELKYINRENILNLNLWEGDKIFLKHILDNDKNFFVYRMEYSNDTLINVIKEM